MGLVDTKPENIIKIYINKGKKGFEFKDLGSKVTKKHKHIYNIVFILADSKNPDKTINVYLTTEEGDHHVFSTWDILP